jgi:hypothetical protein
MQDYMLLEPLQQQNFFKEILHFAKKYGKNFIRGINDAS